jgi:hypothetical protein
MHGRRIKGGNDKMAGYIKAPALMVLLGKALT